MQEFQPATDHDNLSRLTGPALTDLLGAISAEAAWLADGDDARFQSDLALRLNG